MALRSQSILSSLLLIHMTVAVRFSFSIKDITVGRTRDLKEDDLVLAIASNTGVGNYSNVFFLGPIEADQSIKWTNLTQEIDVPTDARNISVALGITNTADATEANITETADTFVRSIVKVAAIVPGPQFVPAQLLELALSFFDGDLFNCDGPVAVGNPVYSQDTLDAMEQNEENCETKEYSLDVPNNCGFQNSTYTVTHCLERLDPRSTNAASRGVMSLSLSLSPALMSVVVAFF